VVKNAPHYKLPVAPYQRACATAMCAITCAGIMFAAVGSVVLYALAAVGHWLRVVPKQKFQAQAEESVD
jgi:hypothetical protein